MMRYHFLTDWGLRLTEVFYQILIQLTACLIEQGQQKFERIKT